MNQEFDGEAFADEISGRKAARLRAEICPPGFKFDRNTKIGSDSYKRRNLKSQPDKYRIVEQAWDANGNLLEGYASVFVRKEE